MRGAERGMRIAKIPAVGTPCSGCWLWLSNSQSGMTAEQILNEIRALSSSERERLVERMRQLNAEEIPQDFIEALDDFEKGRFVSMETALNETPPDA